MQKLALIMAQPQPTNNPHFSNIQQGPVQQVVAQQVQQPIQPGQQAHVSHKY